MKKISLLWGIVLLAGVSLAQDTLFSDSKSYSYTSATGIQSVAVSLTNVSQRTWYVSSIDINLGVSTLFTSTVSRVRAGKTYILTSQSSTALDYLIVKATLEGVAFKPNDIIQLQLTEPIATTNKIIIDIEETK